MTMMVASRTSTPTSMTVVETRTRMVPEWKADMMESFSCDFKRPCSKPTLLPRMDCREVKRDWADVMGR